MAKLYFMKREFKGLCLALDEDIEFGKIELLYPDSWYWLHYEFFNCRDSICSDTSPAVRTHLYNLAAYLYRSFDSLAKNDSDQKWFLETIEEICQIAEAATEFPLSLWIYGDKSSKAFLQMRLASLPSKEQIEHLFTLPHHARTERKDRLPYRFISEEPAIERYRNELAAYNKRKRLALKNKRREELKSTQRPRRMLAKQVAKNSCSRDRALSTTYKTHSPSSLVSRDSFVTFLSARFPCNPLPINNFPPNQSAP